MLELVEAKACVQDLLEAKVYAVEAAVRPQAQLARLGYQQAQAVVRSPPQDEKLECLRRPREGTGIDSGSEDSEGGVDVD